jgi:hypothetical protein
MRDYINGEFVVHKAFQLKLNSNPRVRNIFGYVIQKVEKNTDAYIIDGRSKRIRDISEFTSGQVKYMNESYYELFCIINGQSIDGDNFQNGAILEYTEDIDGSFGPDDRTNTKGTIRITATSWFIKADEKEVKDTYTLIQNHVNMDKVNEVDEINEINATNDIQIMGLTWSLNKNTPTNGLPYIKNISTINIEKLSKNSNILEHNVKVTWDTTKKIDEKSESITTSTFRQIQ